MMIEHNMSKEKKMIFGAVSGIALILGVLLLVNAGFNENKEISEEDVNYFSEEMWRRGVENLGGAMPIEGFDARLFLGAFQGLGEKDFDGVEAIGGKWTYDGELRFESETGMLVTSADGTINKEGMKTLLERLSLRFGVKVDSIEDVDRLIDMIDAQELKGDEVEFSELKKGTNNNINDRETRIIKSAEEWGDLWNEMFPTEMIAPVLDDDKMIIAVFMGERNTGGYSTEIVRVIENEEKINVFIEEVSPGENCVVTQALTQPYHIIELDKSDKIVDFVYSKETASC